MKRFILVIMALLVLTGCGTVVTEGEAPAVEEEPVVEEEPAVEEEPVVEEEPLAFLDDFTEYGYTEEQIEEMRTVLVNVGITELTDLEIGDASYGMQVVKGVAYKGKSLSGPTDQVRVQFNIENGVLFYVHIYCPWDMLDGLDDRSAELYYDYEGGYLKKIDWENKAVVDY